MTDTASLSILAAIQGLAEFLPVSSSAHVALAGRALGVENPGSSLELFLHVGTLFSVCVFYRRTIARLAVSAARMEREGLRYAACVLLTMVPTFLAYLFFKDVMEAAFDSPREIGFLLVANGALLLLSALTDRFRRSGGGPTPWRALAMGAGQALAIMPGISRSGTSIHAGRLAGMPPAKAAEFSFLMSVPVIAGAMVIAIAKHGTEALGAVTPAQALLSTAISALVGLAALRLVVKTVERGRFWTFGIWCLAVGTAAALFA